MHQHYRTAVILLAIAVLTVAPAVAKFQATELEPGIYFVAYQTGRLVQGGLLFDTKKKNTKKLEEKAHPFCAEEGFTHLRFAEFSEIATDEKLKAYWEMMAGGEAVEQEHVGTGGRANTVRAILFLSSEPDDNRDWQECKAKP